MVGGGRGDVWLLCRGKALSPGVFLCVCGTALDQPLHASVLVDLPCATCVQFPDLYVVCTYVPNAGADLKRLDYRVDVWDVQFSRLLKVGRPLTGSLLSGHDLPRRHAPAQLPALSPCVCRYGSTDKCVCAHGAGHEHTQACNIGWGLKRGTSGH